MASPRAVSWNWEIQLDDGTTIYPLEIGAFGEGEEGRIEVADGSRKYKIRDQIFNIDEIEITILIKAKGSTNRDYDAMQAWCVSGDIKDVYLIARNMKGGPDGVGNIMMKYLCSQTELAMGKHNAFNRKSKEADTKKYFMMPWDMQLVD